MNGDVCGTCAVGSNKCPSDCPGAFESTCGNGHDQIIFETQIHPRGDDDIDFADFVGFRGFNNHVVNIWRHRHSMRAAAWSDNGRIDPMGRACGEGRYCQFNIRRPGHFEQQRAAVCINRTGIENRC